MQRSLDSVFGFIPVLPGAFSAYRWIAIRGEPLVEYFKIEELDSVSGDILRCTQIRAKRFVEALESGKENRGGQQEYPLPSQRRDCSCRSELSLLTCILQKIGFFASKLWPVRNGVGY